MISWKKIGFKILFLVLLFFGIAIFLVSTPIGVNLLFNIANFYIPGLEIGQISGGWQNLLLKNIRYHQTDMTISASEIYLAIDLNHLYNGSLYVNNLLLKNINICMDNSLKDIYTSINPTVIFQSQKNKKHNLLNFLRSHKVIFNQIVLRNANIKINNITASIENFTSGLHWKKKNLTLYPTFLNGLLITLPKEDKKKNVKSTIQNLKIEKQSLSATLKDFFSKPILSKTTNIRFPIDINVIELKGKKLHLVSDVDLTVSSMLMKFTSINGNVHFESLSINSNQGVINVTGSTQLHNDNWPVNIMINSTINIKPLQREEVNIKISGAIKKKLEIDINFFGKVNMSLGIKTQLTEKELPIDICILSKKFNWPLIGVRQYQVNDLKLKLSGTIIDYVLSFYTSIKGKNVPSAVITLSAKGNERQINFNKLTVIALEGKTELIALLSWKKSIIWDAELKLDDINIVKKIPNWPSKLDGFIKTSGSFYNGNWKINISKLKINGKLRKNKVNVEGALNGNSYSQWAISRLHIALGYNNVNIKGKMGMKNIDFIAAINVPNLGKMIPKFFGTVKGLIKVSGATKSPQILTNITVNNFRWQQLLISKVCINSNVRTFSQISGKLNIQLKQIIQPGLTLKLATIDIFGNERQHNLKLQMKGKQISGLFHLIGSFNRKERYWKGQLNDTNLETALFRARLLNRSIVPEYCNINQKFGIEQNCRKYLNLKPYIQKKNNVKRKKNNLMSISRLSPDIFRLFTSNNNIIKIKRTFNSKFDVNLDTSKRFLLKSRVILSKYNVNIIHMTNNSPLLVFDIFDVKINFHDNYAKLDWLIHTANNGWFNVKINVNDLQKCKDLNGNINIHNFDLETANIFFSRINKITGILNANLRFVGNIKNLKIYGKTQIDDININDSFIPFEMQPSKITMNFNGMHSTFDGKVCTKNGLIKLNGNADWSQINNLYAYVFIKGNRIRITIPPMVYFDISPDITFKVTPSLFTCNGYVDIPWMRIILHELPESMISVSNDEIILNENLELLSPESMSIQNNSNLIVHMGNDIKVDAFGLNARLTGDLQVKKDKQGISLNGQIDIPEGHFHAYGQDLLICKGELLFSGPPDQPILNIEAIRSPETTEDNVIAGVRVVGTADAPRVKIFSNPYLPQREVISYLLRGQSLDKNQNDNTLMTSVLIGLGVSKSNYFFSKITEMFGVNEITIDTKGIGNSSQLIFSGYVSPSLQIKYGVGIFDSPTTLTLRYHLIPKLYLEFLSGIDQALDLLYHFEF